MVGVQNSVLCCTGKMFSHQGAGRWRSLHKTPLGQFFAENSSADGFTIWPASICSTMMGRPRWRSNTKKSSIEKIFKKPHKEKFCKWHSSRSTQRSDSYPFATMFIYPKHWWLWHSWFLLNALHTFSYYHYTTMNLKMHPRYYSTIGVTNNGTYRWTIEIFTEAWYNKVSTLRRCRHGC